MEKRVYLNTKEAKIEINDEAIDKEGFYELASFEGEDEKAVTDQAKIYCVGYLAGKDLGLKGFDLKNDINEFIV